MMKKLSKLLIFFCLNLTVGFFTFKLLDLIYPLPEAFESKPFSQLVVDRQGRPLRAFADSQGVWRYPTKLSQVSPHYIEALINYEDRQFWQHRGINPLAIIRAFWQRVNNGRWISGGSTLTMQVARILDPHQKNMSGKLWQMFRAYQLEFHLSKEEIITLYLNYAPFGGPIEGVEAAAYTYLGKSAGELTFAESALLAVLPQSPSRFRPDRYHQRAQKARDKVIKRLSSYGVWSKEIAIQARQEQVLADFNSRPMSAPLLARKLAKHYPKKTLVKTTIDLDIQIPVSDLVRQYVERFSETTSAAAMVMDNLTLEVLAYVGTAEFGNNQRFGHIDMNRAIRSPGSTLKPFIYGMALDEQLIHSQSLLQDVPLNFGGYNPQNFTRNFAGPVSVTEALQQSLNIPAVQVLSHLGVGKFAAKLENAGLNLAIPGKSKPSLSLALGGAGVSLTDLVGSYRSFAAGGLAGKPRYVQEAPIEERHLLSAESAWIIGDMLAGVPLEPRQKNPFLKKHKRWLAHKTGTSYGHRDAWMIAVTPEYTIGVWIGKPDGTPSPGEFGRKTAAPLVKRITHLLPGQKVDGPSRPQKVSLANICWPLGKLASSTIVEHCHQKKPAFIIEGVAPATLTQQQVIQSNPMNILVTQDNGKRVLAECYSGKVARKSIALWPSKLEMWLKFTEQKESLVPAFHQDCLDSVQLTQRLNILGVENRTTLVASPDSKANLELSLSVSSSHENLTWLLNGQLIGTTENDASMLLSNLQTGDYQVMVYSPQGEVGQVSFNVM